MNDDPPFYMLAKFGRAEHVHAFRERGHLYMNSLAYFWNLEGDGVRQDWMEGADNLIHPDEFSSNFSVTIDGETYRINRNLIAGPVKVSWGTTAATNLFCMYAFRYPPTHPLADPRNFGFGDSCVLVLKVMEFIERVRQALREQGFKYKIDLVEYGEPELGEARPLNVFKKTRHFDYQSEFRIAVFGPTRSVDKLTTPLSLEVGSLKDVTSDILPLGEINNLLTVGPTSRNTPMPARKRRKGDA